MNSSTSISSFTQLTLWSTAASHSLTEVHQTQFLKINQQRSVVTPHSCGWSATVKQAVPSFRSSPVFSTISKHIPHVRALTVVHVSVRATLFGGPTFKNSLLSLSLHALSTAAGTFQTKIITTQFDTNVKKIGSRVRGSIVLGHEHMSDKIKYLQQTATELQQKKLSCSHTADLILPFYNSNKHYLTSKLNTPVNVIDSTELQEDAHKVVRSPRVRDGQIWQLISNSVPVLIRYPMNNFRKHVIREYSDEWPCPNM